MSGPAIQRVSIINSHAGGVPGLAPGDVACGGNWFFLVAEHGQRLERANLDTLTDFARRLRPAANAQGFPVENHVELFGRWPAPGVHSRNLVLCPGGADDRSPCGTGTSAKLACLAAEGRLAEGAGWVRPSIVGGVFRGKFLPAGGKSFRRSAAPRT